MGEGLQYVCKLLNWRHIDLKKKSDPKCKIISFDTNMTMSWIIQNKSQFSWAFQWYQIQCGIFNFMIKPTMNFRRVLFKILTSGRWRQKKSSDLEDHCLGTKNSYAYRSIWLDRSWKGLFSGLNSKSKPLPCQDLFYF